MFFDIAKPFRARSGQPDCGPWGGKGLVPADPSTSQKKLVPDHLRACPEQTTAGGRKGSLPSARGDVLLGLCLVLSPALHPGAEVRGVERTPPLSGLCSRAGEAHPLRIFRKGMLATRSAKPSKNAEEERVELDRAINLLSRTMSRGVCQSTPFQSPL